MGVFPHINSIMRRFGGFLLRVLNRFRQNQGMLLSGAVAYYTLLSLIPMIALTLVVMSHFLNEEQLFHTISTYLEMVVPRYASTLTEQVQVFLSNRQVIGVVGFIFMLFFSSMAFTVLENAMSVIFFHRFRIQRRHFLISAVIPYIYIFLLCMGISIVSFIAGVLQTIEDKELMVLGMSLKLAGASRTALYVFGIFGEVLMLTSLYLVMPVGRVTFRHALMGGVLATVLWEITRHVLVWYFSTLSLVNVIYGSLSTAVVALLSIEVAVIILLIGAQVIAEFERKAANLEHVGETGFET
jgi:membrane protein